MKMPRRLLAILVGSAVAPALMVAIAVAQPASEGAGENPQKSMGMPGSGGMMGGGGMRMGMGGMGGMPMGCMHGMHKEMMQMMQHDPKLKGRMMELHGEMMRTMGEALIAHGKELQQTK
jgi:hypothetical protein